jgi:hypothetical protein
MNHSRTGVTLIEVLVYLGLFAILIGGTVTAAFALFESGNRNQTKAFIQQEGDFIAGKLEWALSGIQAVNAPTASGSLLSVNKWDPSIGAIVVDMDPGTGTDIRLARGSNPPVTLNSAAVRVSGLLFSHILPTEAEPESVSARFTVTATMENGMTISKDFSVSKYLRR